MLGRGYPATLFAAGTMFAGCGAGICQGFPAKPIRLVSTEIGGGADFSARTLGQALAARFGQQLIVDNRPSGVIPGEIVFRAAADGYTLLVYGGTFWLGPLLQDKVPYDVIRDFAPITLVASSPNVLVVNPSLPAKSVKDLIALARARPGELNYASTAAGSSPHLAAELFKALAAVDIVRIPYKGVGQAVSDLIAGQVQLMFGNAATVAQHMSSGKLRALAVSSAQPSVFFPAMPTISASGVPGYESGANFGVFAPAKTPGAIISQLHQESAVVLNTPDVKERFFKSGLEVVASSPEQFAAKVKSEMTRIGKVIKDAGICAE